ncbi:DUF4190 domain-containing protein [Acidiferrimicrobium sp. IK]|nr:DUF4190 domain-containing protein [Acidiferrimicrobium sp. IK]
MCGLVGGWLFALVFGYVAKSQIARHDGRQSGYGMATAAIILGWLEALLTVVLLGVLISFTTR